MNAPLSDLHRTLAGLTRETDARRLNEVVNHPSVLPYVRGFQEPPLDLTPAVEAAGNVLLMGEHGGVLFHKHMPGLYEAHTQVLPEGRGAWTVAMVRGCLHWLFTRTDAVEIVTRCPRGNVAAKVLAKVIGGTYETTNRRGWVMHGEIVPADIYALKIQDWMRDAPGLVERGRWFHDRLESEYARLGRVEPLHEDDLAHDRYVGAACEMMLNGQPGKGVAFYNRYAVLSDYAPARIVMPEPLAIDINEAVLIVRDEDFYVASITADAA